MFFDLLRVFIGDGMIKYDLNISQPLCHIGRFRYRMQPLVTPGAGTTAPVSLHTWNGPRHEWFNKTGKIGIVDRISAFIEFFIKY
jgi:hypothetical protein